YLSVLKQSVSARSGEILNDYGDGSLCTFHSATDAIQCALEMQAELRNEPSVPLRIGLHIGEIFFHDEKVYGDGVNIASRIQTLAQGNTIFFSGEINSKIKNHPEFKAVSLGYFEFKNIDESMEVFALANDGLIVPDRKQRRGKLKEVQKKTPTKKLILASVIVLLLIASGVIYQKFSGGNSIIDKGITIAVLPFK